MIHWDRNEHGDLMPRDAPLPVAAASRVLEDVAHLDGSGTLRLPVPQAVLAGLRYGPDLEWVGQLDAAGGEIPPDPADGWGRLRALLRARLDGLRAWLGEARGMGARGAAPTRALPAGAFDLVAENGSRPDAGFYRASLRLSFFARASAELDPLSQGAESLLVGWILDDNAWSARGFVLASQEDRIASADSPEGAGAPVLVRTQTFAFHARRAVDP